MMLNEQWIGPELERLKQKDLMRHASPFRAAGGKLKDENGQTLLNFSSNDYLNFSQRPEVVAAASSELEGDGCGAGASRLMSGTLPMHERLEEDTARHKGYPCALIFGSGFLANVGSIPALAGRDDTIYADKLVHASIIDGIRSSRARLIRFRHNDTEHLSKLLKKRDKESGRALVITESVFSMDGDLAPVQEIARLCTRHHVMLMVDESHATGVFGPCGGGMIMEHGLQKSVNVAMGTYSKAIGNYGGFVACSQKLRSWLVNRARSFIFSTAPPPSVLGGCAEALRLLHAEPGLGEQLLNRAEAFRVQLQQAGLDTGRSCSQIIPVMVGANDKALRLAERLREKNVVAVPVRPPSVPRGTARLRLSVTLAHERQDLVFTVSAIYDAAKAEGVI